MFWICPSHRSLRIGFEVAEFLKMNFLKGSEDLFMYFRFVVLSLCIVILIQRSSLESFNLVEHVPSKMSEKEADPAMEEERIIELKKEKRNRKTVLTKTHFVGGFGKNTQCYG